MKQLTCEMCGSTDLLKQDGVFVCQSCNTKYSVEDAKKMIVEDDVSNDQSKILVNYISMITNAMDTGNLDEALTYCNKSLEIAPNESIIFAYKALVLLNKTNNMPNNIEKQCMINEALSYHTKAMNGNRETFLETGIGMARNFLWNVNYHDNAVALLKKCYEDELNDDKFALDILEYATKASEYACNVFHSKSYAGVDVETAFEDSLSISKEGFEIENWDFEKLNLSNDVKNKLRIEIYRPIIQNLIKERDEEYEQDELRKIQKKLKYYVGKVIESSPDYSLDNDELAVQENNLNEQIDELKDHESYVDEGDGFWIESYKKDCAEAQETMSKIQAINPDYIFDNEVLRLVEKGKTVNAMQKQAQLNAGCGKFILYLIIGLAVFGLWWWLAWGGGVEGIFDLIR